MKIKILNKANAAQFIQENPGEWDVVSIRDSRDKGNFAHPVEMVLGECRDMLVVHFDDISFPIPEFPQMKLVKEKHIRKVLEWAGGRDQLLVHCNAGEHRSAAIAYLVACGEWPPAEAIRILDPDIHEPTQLVIEMGANILNDEAVYRVCADLYDWLPLSEQESR